MPTMLLIPGDRLDLRDPDRLGARIDEWRIERERRLEAAQRLKQVEELRECTFAPKVRPI